MVSKSPEIRATELSYQMTREQWERVNIELNKHLPHLSWGE